MSGVYGLGSMDFIESLTNKSRVDMTRVEQSRVGTFDSILEKKKHSEWE